MRKFFRALSGENSVRGASVILMVTLALSNVLGLFRDMLLSRNVAFTDSDIYFAAFRIPDTVFNFLILGAITSAFIPVFSEVNVKRGKEEGWKVASALSNICGLVMVFTALAFYFFIPYLMPFVAKGFTAEKLTEAIRLSRLLMLTPIFFSVSYIVGGVLNSYGRFFAFSLSPLFYNIAIIVGIAWAAPKYGLIGIVYFVVIGSLLHFFVQLPALFALGFRHQLTFDWRDPAIKRIWRLMIPRSLSLGANQILLTVFTSVGSAIATGAISAFNYANNIQTVPTVILGNSFAMAVFPTLSKKIAEDDKDGFTFYLVRTLRVIGFLLIPSTVVFILLRAQIARLVIGLGHASWGETKMTALALAAFSISFLAQGLIPLVARAFFALKNTRLPMWVSIISVVVSIILAYPLAEKYSVFGLSLAFSVGSFIQIILLLTYLHKQYPGILDRSLFVSYAKTVLVSLFMGACVWVTMHLVANYVDMYRYLGVLIQTVVSLIVGLIIYLGTSYLFGAEEIKWAFSRRINGKVVETISEQMPQ